MKTNGTPLTHAPRCLGFILLLFIYSESHAQSGFGTDEPLSVKPGSQTLPSSLLAKASNPVASTGKSASLARSRFYDDVPEAAGRGDRDTSMAAPMVKPADLQAGNQNALARGNYLIRFKRSSFIYPRNPRKEVGLNYFETGQLRLYAYMLKKYAVAHHFDTAYAFIANMGMLSNRKRFFVINLKTMEVEQSGLVSHGRGPGMSIYDRNYSNDPDSKCTSLGRYKVSASYRGTFGLSYRIMGLDSTNSNAQKRRIVLHSMHCIPDLESIMPACVSEGCPAVSEHFFSSIRKLIDTRRKPMLLWIIDSNLEMPEITEMTDNNPPPLVIKPIIISRHATAKTTHTKKHSPARTKSYKNWQ